MHYGASMDAGRAESTGLAGAGQHASWYFGNDSKALDIYGALNEAGYYHQHEISEMIALIDRAGEEPEISPHPMFMLILSELRNSRTLAEFLNILVQRFVYLPANHLWLQSRNGSVRLCYEFPFAKRMDVLPQWLPVFLYREMMRTFNLSPDDMELTFAKGSLKDEAGVRAFTGISADSFGQVTNIHFRCDPQHVDSTYHNPYLSPLISQITNQAIHQYHPGNRISSLVLAVLEQRIQANQPVLGQGDIASLLGMSRVTPYRKLRDTGQSYSGILQTLRQRKAGDLLSKQDMSIAEISRLLGYSGAATFSRSFRALTGKSPNQYRSELL